MPGTVVAVAVQAGQRVRKGEELLTMETMKMNVPVNSPRDGAVAALHVKPGDSVRTGQPLLDFARRRKKRGGEIDNCPFVT
jgi:biotin carboxyl carrier protein